MAFITIVHKRSECIGCGLCIEAAPDYWAMNAQGEAQLIQIASRRDAHERGQALRSDLLRLKAAVEGCPVNIIRIEK